LTGVFFWFTDLRSDCVAHRRHHHMPLLQPWRRPCIGGHPYVGYRGRRAGTVATSAGSCRLSRSSVGCCACLGRLPQLSCRRRLRTGRLAFTNRAATSDASSEGRLGTSLLAPRLRGLHRRSVFAVVARDFTDHIAIYSDLRDVVNVERTHTSSV
jgi:hypothetical protein